MLTIDGLHSAASWPRDRSASEKMLALLAPTVFRIRRLFFLQNLMPERDLCNPAARRPPCWLGDIPRAVFFFSDHPPFQRCVELFWPVSPYFDGIGSDET